MTTSLVGLRLRYLIGAGEDNGEEGAFTVVGYDSIRKPLLGIGGIYFNCFFEKYADATSAERAAYGPYLTTSDAAREYQEGQCDPNGAGFWRNVTDQIARAKANGFTILGDVDNRDAYSNDIVLKVYDQAAAAGFSVICKNPGMSDSGQNSTVLLKHPAVVGAIVEQGNVSPPGAALMRAAAGKPDLPVWFVAFDK